VTGHAWEPAPLALERAGIVLDVERLVYGEADVAERAHYEWLYRTNPAGDAVIWYAATRDPGAESAGHYAVVPARVAVRGAVRTGSVSVNTVTHPRYRRQGVFAVLAERVFAECARRGIEFTYGFPNPASLPGFVGRLGFADIGRVPLLIAPLDARAIAPPASSGARRLALRTAMRGGSAVAALVRRASPGGEAPVDELGADAADWDLLWTRLRGKYPVMVVRDRRYVAWRFGACPTRRYRLYVARGAEGPAGLVVTRVDSVLGMRAGLVVDFVVASGRSGREAGRGLLAAALREFAEARVGLAASLMPAIGEEYACLRRAGFFRCPTLLEPQPFPVILRRHAASAAVVPAAIGDWLLTMGDYDAV
jgi:GNAT superfamily N-acetyltransferase